jgi:phage terminase small subunit
MSILKEKKLTELQEKFCQEYVRTNGNKRVSLINAGYSDKHWQVTSRSLLTNPHIVRKIKDLEQLAKDKETVTKEDLIKELKINAHLARDDKKYNQSNEALKLIAELKGYMVQKQEIQTTSISETLQAIADRRKEREDSNKVKSIK